MKCKKSMFTVIGLCLAIIHGCGADLLSSSDFRFLAPLAIEKEEVEAAIIDTGGGYEILLRSTYDIPLVDMVDVITFRGIERVGLTAPFNYSAGSIGAVSDGAIVGISTCDCNGLGFEFFRKTGLVLSLDFDLRQAAFLTAAPSRGVHIPFDDTPATFRDFNAAFMRVVIDIRGIQIPATALVDTGATRTIIQRDLTEKFVIQQPNFVELTLTQSKLGSVTFTADVFDNNALPDIIIGLDIMEVWGSQWFFDFAHEGSSFTVFPNLTKSAALARTAP